MRALALLLYAMGNMSFCSIARILGVSADQVVVTLDEMWNFLKKRLASCGFGEPMTLLLGEPSLCAWWS